MHWYKKDIGKYAKKAARLTMLQHGAYTILIDSCYDREQFPTLEQAIDWCWASSEDEIAAVKFVLNKFFTLDNDGVYTDADILLDLLGYKENANKNKAIALDREAKKRENKTNRSINSTNRAQVVNDTSTNEHELAPNYQLSINNHQSLINNQELNKNISAGAQQKPHTQEPYTNRTQIVNEWTPNQQTLEVMLQRAGVPCPTQKELDAYLVAFNPYYENKVLTENQKHAKLVTWIQRSSPANKYSKNNQLSKNQETGNWRYPYTFEIEEGKYKAGDHVPC